MSTLGEPTVPTVQTVSSPAPSEIGNGDPWGRVEDVLRAHYHEPDLQAARAVYAAVAAHRLSGAPVWVMLVSPPGSMKTELLNGMVDVEKVHFIDQVTPNTFISGQIVQEGSKGSGSPGLLHRIGESGILVYPDFSTVLGMKAEAKASVLADMRRIYDGRLHKEYGTANNLKQRDWKGRITFVVAATPDVDRHYSIFQTLGERFLMVRVKRAGGIEAALTAMNQDMSRARDELRSAVTELVGSLPQIEPKLSGELEKRIAALSELTVRARTHVPREGYSKEIVYQPEPESATRIAQELAQLAKGSALLDGRTEVNEDDYSLVRRVAVNCIPATRFAILTALMKRRALNSTGLPSSTIRYATEDLELVQLVKDKQLTLLAICLVRLARLL